MNHQVKHYTLAAILFVVLLSTASTFGTVVGEVIYYLAFLLPLLWCVHCAKSAQRKSEEIAGVAEPPRKLFSLNKEGWLTTILLCAPVVAVVLLLSYLTSLLFSLFGLLTPSVADAPIFVMIIEHAVAPSILEELLFRFAPLLLLAPYSRRGCVVISALYFALIHCNLFQIPYALIAGGIFIIVDLAFDSVLPSMVLHLVNNVASVVMLKYCSSGTPFVVYLAVVIALALVSLLLLVLWRKKLFEGASCVFGKGEAFTTMSPVALVVLTMGIAVFNLL